MAQQFGCGLASCFLLFSISYAQPPSPAGNADRVQDSAIHSLSAMLSGDGFAPIPAGEFEMGSGNGNPDEQPPHNVRISRGFEIGKYEVTQAQWDAVMRNPHARADPKQRSLSVNPSHFKGPARPVENVTYEAVQQFIQTLNKRDTEYLYRLPTEAEWEYAARAGSSEFQERDLDSVAWYAPNSGGQTQPVGQRAPNPWGLYDMLGNVFEWIDDWYSVEYYASSPPADPKGPTTGSYKVYRGCAWLSEAKYCRPAYRGFDFPSQGYYSVGFRLVRTPKPRL